MPLTAMKHIGVVHSEEESAERGAILKKIKKLFSKLADYAPIDAAADQMAKDFIHDALPPVLNAGQYIRFAFTAEQIQSCDYTQKFTTSYNDNSDEQKCSVLNSERMGDNGELQGTVELELDTLIRLTRANVLR